MKKSLLLAIALILVCANLSFAKTVKQYYDNGKVRAVYHYNRKGVMDGPYKLYWENGRLKEKGVYKNGHLMGGIKRYTAKGVLMGR